MSILKRQFTLIAIVFILAAAACTTNPAPDSGQSASRADAPVAAAPETGESVIGRAAPAESESQLQETPRADSERIKVLRDRLYVHGTGRLKHTFLRLDEDENPLDPESITGGNVLDLAARSYAIAELDFHVTLRDLVDKGWWPVTSVPESELDKSIPNIWRYPFIHFEREFQLLSSDISGWIIHAKQNILDDYYQVYLFDFKDYSRSFNNITFNPLFWVNPVTGSAMEESLRRGDYRIMDSGILERRLTGSSEPRTAEDLARTKVYGVQLRYINFKDRNQKQRQASSESCCIYEFKFIRSENPSYHNDTWTCYCEGGGSWVCHLSWHYSCSNTVTWWEPTLDYGCEDELPHGYIKRNCGQRAPDTIYSAGCVATLLGPPCFAPTCLDVGDECYLGFQDFIANLTNGESASAPGAYCGC